MKLSLTSDFAGSRGEPAPSLKALAEGGFTNVLWCHHWNDDFLYGKDEIDYLKSLFREYGLALSDIHGSQGMEKCWHSPVEYCRKAGVELVANRIRMLREMDGEGTVMMHVPNFSINDDASRPVVQEHFDALCRSLDELMPLLEEADTAISAENMWMDSWELIEALLARYPADRLGICYDSGHANANGNKRIDSLDRNKGRLTALHLDDNDGTGDQHQPP
jgi:sugar phosphate isomerase/epimerase